MFKKVNVDDFVWAKLTGYPAWPSVIIEPELDVPERPLNDPEKYYYWVYFFGSHDYSWIEERHIKPYEQYKDKYVPLHKTSVFLEAVEELEEHLQKTKNDPKYKVEIVEKFRVHQQGVKRHERQYSSKNKRKRLESIDIDSGNTKSNPEAAEILQTDILPTKHIFGVIGTGNIGGGLVRNLIKSGYTVNIWNRSSRKIVELEKHLSTPRNVKSHLSPRAVMLNSDIIFICVSDHLAAKHIIHNSIGNNSHTLLKDKGVVIMTNIDPKTSKDIQNIVEEKGGNYLEVQMQGSKVESVEERFCFLTAGSEDLYHACQPCFYAMGGTTTFFLGEVGNASKINLIIQLMKGICLVALTEGLALAERCNVAQDKFLDIFNITGLSSTYLKAKANIVARKNFSNTEQSLNNLQKDLMLALELSQEIGHPLPLSSVANQIFKHCVKLEYGNQDASAVYLRNKH